MLLLTKLDQTRVLVCIETIKYIEETPDTLIKFLNGESMIVQEPLETIQNLALDFRRRILNGDDDSKQSAVASQVGASLKSNSAQMHNG